MNTYRVDRNNAPVTPCGMNSILYIGDNYQQARKVYDAAQTGLDAWGQPNATYGVVLSVWNGESAYVVKCMKGLT